MTLDTTSAAPQSFPAEREFRPAVLRGWRRRCPNCGSGPMLRGYLQVRESCAVCGEELHHHRADDGPAYLTILIVGHIMAPMIFWAFVHFRPEPLVLASVFTVGTVGLSLYLLPRLKGALVAIQWAKRMHGFGAKA
ncbi:DUF983 domain-containing protein [Pseudogemmobacter sp. W21_MBD1_M6]|uniref:DUF983 domain-containing protein n=1 Tax=Pseudogemmobacter sp. W21_MBD1_M6 TaxID=3240271 RepID=UPI003F9D369C